MTTGLAVETLWFPIGTGDFFHCFFSTICYNLELGDWGSRFPRIMIDLYQGHLACKNVPEARAELLQVQAELAAFDPGHVVWDIEDLDKQPPWGDNISDEITDLSNYFVTSEGVNLFDVMLDAFDCSIEESEDVVIENI